MSDTTGTPPPSNPTRDRPRRRFLRRAAIAALVAGVATGIGVKAFAHGGFGGWHRAGFMGAPLDPARLDEHLDRMLRHLYVEIDATDAQKQVLAPIVKSAARELVPLRARIHNARRQAVELLSRESIDRAALETLRGEQVRLVDQRRDGSPRRSPTSPTSSPQSSGDRWPSASAAGAGGAAKLRGWPPTS